MSNRDSNRKVTEVAVGVIFNEDGAFLLAKRPPGKPYADYWEFPGGKLEQGESVHQALERELVEELGILIQGSHAWEIIEHDYPHAYVRLHLLIVKQWQGEVQGLEGQELHWQAQNGNDLAEVSPLLPATITIIQMLRDINKVS